MGQADAGTFDLTLAGFAAQVLGVARRCVDAVTDLARSRVTPGPMPDLRDRPAVAIEVARRAAAIDSARIHHQWLPDKIRVEARTDMALRRGLEARGHVVEAVPWGSGSIGHANCIEVDPETGGFRAVADVSRDGGGAVAF